MEEGTCFVIMPFGGRIGKYFEEIYEPAIKAAKLKPKRADSIIRSSNIIQDIWDFTKEAKILIADLTGQNPNVFYELGLAHALAKPVVLVASDINDVPFDLRGLRVIIYDKNDPQWGEKLKADITKSIEESLENITSAIPPTFLDVSDIEKPEVSKLEKRILGLEAEVRSIEASKKPALYR